jgi:predicted metal-dependent hydrolase
MIELDIPIRHRVSKRASRISARIDTRGIEVVLPVDCTQSEAIPLLQQHQRWFKKKWSQLQQHQANRMQHTQLPLTIAVPLIQRDIHIKVEQGAIGYQLHCLLSDAPDMPDCSYALGRHMEKDTVQSHILQWLNQLAEHLFEPILEAHAAQMGLVYTAFSTAFYRSRWGACTEKSAVSLNSALLFFDEDVVRYVVIHELAHLVHMNHSQVFWKLVRQFCPNYAMMKAKLRQGEAQLPPWLFDSEQLVLDASTSTKTPEGS